jgi:hydroxymethylpyrimidine/phosphomethylpyrimidine kinase
MRVVLTIGGSDSGGAAGVQADIKTLAAHGVHGVSAITAITAQNTLEIIISVPLSPQIVAAQIAAVAGDFDVDTVKIGMLATGRILDAVARELEDRRFHNVVVDPVMRSTTGASLLDPEGIARLRSRLLPLASVVTPNVSEAERLCDMRITSVADAHRAADRLLELGVRAVIVKGGHLPGTPIDVVHAAGAVIELDGARVDSTRVHGTGCAFAAALAARLALGDDVPVAALAAKRYVQRAIERAPRIGHGRGPLGY